ncbi:hypothetical protein ANDA3_3185 [plant metagenome]|uniref:Uncharacterized protein n=2 Tax=root TaxID=1 RepID=A0A1C3K0L5_9BURK|nr:hypothetical protein ODI_00340 [Orrella dioscoreae]SOE51087.1 hypothetical protein ODI_R3184 [Orrella dioscoreae]
MRGPHGREHGEKRGAGRRKASAARRQDTGGKRNHGAQCSEAARRLVDSSLRENRVIQAMTQKVNENRSQ